MIYELLDTFFGQVPVDLLFLLIVAVGHHFFGLDIEFYTPKFLAKGVPDL